MAVDSGACDSVADLAQTLCEVREAEESRFGAQYASAAGEPIPTLGEMMLPIVAREGSL